MHETKESIPYLQMWRRKLFKNCSLSKAFRTCVMPVLLYGAKTWVVTQHEMRNMKTFHMYTGHPWLHTVYILSTVVVVPSSYSTKMPPALPIVLLQLLVNYSNSPLLHLGLLTRCYRNPKNPCFVFVTELVHELLAELGEVIQCYM